MDALPIEEETNLPYASKTPGLMHACGHDGHTAMLLGAARYLAETRNFAGDAVVIFQPAEEGGAGAEAMIKDGLMDRFGIEQVYGMHNGPGIPVGSFAIRSGPIMAATDSIDVRIEGLGGHAARPHKCIDSVLVGSQLIAALQTIVSRTVDPLDSAVISICEFHAGHARNVIPQTAELRGTVRTLTAEVRALVEKRVREVVAGVAQMTGARIDLTYERGYPVTGAAGRVHLLRQWRHRRIASPRLQFQRRCDRVRHLVLDQAGGEYAGGVRLSTVIASEAKQSILSCRSKMDCFAALAMTRQKQKARADGAGLFRVALQGAPNARTQNKW